MLAAIIGVAIAAFVVILVALFVRQMRVDREGDERKREEEARQAAIKARAEAIDGLDQPISARFVSLVQQGGVPAAIASELGTELELTAKGMQIELTETEFRDVIARAWQRTALASYEFLAAFPHAAEAIVEVGSVWTLGADERGDTGPGPLAKYESKSSCLASLYRGSPAEIPIADSQVFINLQTGEKLLWYEEATYSGYVTETEIIGEAQTRGLSETTGALSASGGFSAITSDNLAIGSFSASGDFRSETVHAETTSSHQRVVTQENIQQLDVGLLGVTDHHIYFIGNDRHRFRRRYDEIVSILQYDDAISIVPDARDARPEILITGDGQFLHYLVSAVIRASRT